jgi:hypothetical protein
MGSEIYWTKFAENELKKIFIYCTQITSRNSAINITSGIFKAP